MIFQIFKKNKKVLSCKRQKGMTYVELIVVMAIFSVLYGVVIFNYQGFKDRVAIKNLAVEIASTINKAQQNSISGVLPLASLPLNWKPSYGVYFNINTPSTPNTGPNIFYYFTDINAPAGRYDEAYICPSDGTSECLEKITMNRGNYISEIKMYDANNQTANVSDLHITFERPKTEASIESSLYIGAPKMVDIVLSSPSGATSTIRVYASGRIDVI